MINPGLILLVRLNLRGLLRASWRRLRTLKGALTALLVTPLLLLVLGSQLYIAFAGPQTQPLRADQVRLFLPPLALVLLLSEAWAGRALAFRPQELDFLFPAPVSRRELLAYHLLSRFPVRLLSAAWFSLFLIRTAPHPLGGVLAPLLLFAFLHVATQMIALLGAAGAAWAGAWRSRAVWGVLGGVGLWSVARAVQAGGGALAGLQAALDTPGLRLLMLPLRPFAEVMAAETARGLVAWCAGALGVVALVTGAIFALDVAYQERAAAASRRALLRLQRAGAGHAAGTPRPWKLRVRFPLPRPLGAGAPLAWRQAVEMIRNPRALFLPLVLPGLYAALFLALPALDGEPLTRGAAVGAIAVAVMVPLVMPNVGFDFRRDMDRMPMLRGLPLHPFAVAAGQIFAPALAFVAAQAAVVLGVALISDAISPLWSLAALALGMPLTWAVVALDNLLFLWMPYRFTGDGAQNLQFAGKTMLILAVKLLVLAVLGGLAGAAAYGAYRVTVGSQPVAVLAAALVMALGCVPLTWAVGGLFQHFDLAGDLPA